MKIRKLLAAMLCLAVTVTSLGMDVSAVTADALTGGDVLVTEDSSELSVRDDNAAVLSDDGNAVLQEDAGDVLVPDDEQPADGPVSADDIIEDTAQTITEEAGNSTISNSIASVIGAEKEREASPFKQDTDVLELIDTLDSLEEWDLDSVVIPASVRTIPASDKLFQNNNKTKTVTFENATSVTEIEAEAFLNSGITKFSMPSGVTEIEDNTFEGCTALEKIVLNRVTTIGNAAFKGCTALTSTGVSGGTYVTSIGNNAFENTGFTVLSFGSMTQKYITVGNEAFANCLYMTKAVLPAGFLTIPEGCFKGAKKLERVEIGSRTMIVCTKAFLNCEALTSVDFKNVEEIETLAFDGCKKIETIDLPASVIEIADRAFYKCDNLKYLFIRHKNSVSGVADDIDLAGKQLVYYPKNLTIYGYDGEVEKYANSNNIRFESLFTELEVKIGDNYQGWLSSWKFSKKDSKTGKSVTGTTIKARPGETVGVTMTGLSSYLATVVLTKVYDINDREGEEIPFSFVAGNQTTQMFSFTMPARPVVVGFDWVAKETITKGTLGYELTGYDYKYDEVTDSEGNLIGYSTATSGNKAQLQIYVDHNRVRYPLGTWSATYKTSNAAVATISSTGVITAVGQGEADITFTAQSKSTKFRIFVTSNVKVRNLEFDQLRLEEYFDGARYGTVDTVKRKYSENGTIVERTVPRIRYYKSDLNNSNQTFKINLLAYDLDGGEVNVNAAWSVTDEKIATLANKTNYDNVNTVTVKKGCSGETDIKAAFTTDEKDKNDKNIVRYAYAVLQVLDPSPKASGNTYVVNKQCSYVSDMGDEDKNNDGAVIEIIATEGYSIVPEKMGQLLYKDTALNSTDTFKGIKVTYIGKSKDHDRGYLYRLTVIDGKNGDAQVNALKENKTIEYSDKTQLYMRGKFADTGVLDGLEGQFYYVPIPKLIIFNQMLKPTVKQTGQINIFYNSSCYEPENNDWAGWQEVLGDKAVKSTEDSAFLTNKAKFISNTVGEITVVQSYTKKNASVDYDGEYNSEDMDNNREIEDYCTDIAPDQPLRIRLISEKNYAYFLNSNKRGSRETKNGNYFDSFAYNFTVAEAKNGKDFIIRRSENSPMAQLNGRDVTSGYLLIYYKGYKEPVAYKLNINPKNQGPAYVLSPASATDNYLNYDGGTSNDVTFMIGLYNKKTGKSALYDDDDLDADYPYVDQENSTRGNGKTIYNKDMTVEPYLGMNIMTVVKNQSYAKKSRAVIVVKKTWWDKVQKFTYTVDESDKAPTGRFSSTSIPLNRFMPATENSITYKVNQGPCTLDIKEGNPVEVITGKQTQADFDKLTVSWESSGDGTQALVVKAEINDETVPKGTYRYKFTPVATFNSGRSIQLKEVSFAVTVTEAQPVIRLSNVNYNFNTQYPGVETYKVNATFGSVPAGLKAEDYDLDSSGAYLEPTAKAGTAAYTTAQAIAGKFRITKFAYNKETKKVDFFCKLENTGLSSFNYAYNLKGLELNGAVLKPLKVTVRSHNGLASVTIQTSGKINSVDKWSEMTVKPTFKNLVNPELAAINYVELDRDKGEYLPNTRFAIRKETNPDKDTTLGYVSATHSIIGGKDSCTNTAHNVILQYTVGSKIVETAAFNITPAQTMPVVTASPDNATFYNNADPANRVATVELTKTSVLNASVNPASKNKGIKLSDKNPKELKDAFEVTYSTEGRDAVPVQAGTTSAKAGKAIIKCTAPELLIQGQTYNLLLEPEWDGQFENSTGCTVTVKVTVK